MTIPTGHLLRVTLNFSLPTSSAIQNVWYFESDFTAPQGTGAVIDAIGEHFSTLFGELAGFLDEELNVLPLDIYEVTDDYPVGSAVWGVEGGLEDQGGALPAGVAAMILQRTQFKRCVGRKYIAGMGETHFLAGTFTGPAQAALNGFALSTMNDISVNVGDILMPRVWSPTDTDARPISSATFSGIPAYQRRRRGGSGS